jgi:poly(beta-D-mannuronate) lyase
MTVLENPGSGERHLGGARALMWLAVSLMASGAANAACQSFAIVARVDGVPFYADKAGSVVDPEAQHRNEAEQAPIRNMLLYVETALDAKDGRSPTTDCASAVIEDWAEKKAMAERPKTFEGLMRRQDYTIGLAVIALKLSALGYSLTEPTQQWLRFLVDSVIDTYRQSSLRNNLYAWAGVAAAGYALVTPHPRASDFEHEVWRTSITEISPDGFLPKEVTRAHRALIYHQYAFSALLMLRQMRLALGESESESDRAALQRLANRISANLCDPQQMAAASGATQEMPDQTAFRVPDTFGDGLLDANWAKCGIAPPHYNDVNLGGRLDLTARLLQRRAVDHPR